MPGKQPRALCPVCQEPMPPDETECGNCGAFVIDEAVVRLSRAFGIPREKALALFEKGFRHPRQLENRDLDRVLEGSEDGLLYICTNCGSFVAPRESRCLRCGAEFEEEAPLLQEKDILDLVLCPVCGADNDPAWKECEICGEPLGGTEDIPDVGAPANTEPEAPVARGPELEEVDEFLDDEIPTSSKQAVRASPRVSRVPKVPRPVPPSARGSARPPRPKTAPRPRPRRPLRPTPRPPRVSTPSARMTSAPGRAPSPPPRSSRRPPDARARRRTGRARPPRRSPRSVSPDDFLGGAMVASGILLAVGLGAVGAGLAWIVAFVIAVLTAYGLGLWTLAPENRIRRREIGLLAGGAALGVSAIALPTAVMPLASVAGAACLALAARHLLPLPSRSLLAVSAGVPLVALALAAATGAVATSMEWIVSIVAALPWPAGVAVFGLRARRAAADLSREVVEAQRHMDRRDYGRSLANYDRAIQAGSKGVPGEDLPWYGKGASLVLLGRYEEALQAIDKALDLNPHNEVAWVNKGNALTKMGRLADALRCFNAALKVNPDYEVAWNNRGNALARMGRYEDALRCYEKALRIDPGYRGAWVNKGYVLTKLGRYEEASACADRALRASERPRAGLA